MSARPSKPRLLLFAFGDFAFNLFWQSIMLFLLFYYTDALNLPIGVAATTYMVASIWDGIANFIAGVLVDRRHSSLNYGRLLVVGAEYSLETGEVDFFDGVAAVYETADSSTH